MNNALGISSPSSVSDGDAVRRPVSMVPEPYRHLLHVRRGGTFADQAPLDSDAVRTLRAKADEAMAMVDRALENPSSDREPVEALRAFLAGQPDALGAAVLLALLHQDCEAAFADALVAEHGMVFAAEAVASLGKVAADPHWDVHANGVYHCLKKTDPNGELTGGWQLPAWRHEPVARRVRALLSVASDADHDAVEQVLSKYREHRACRLIVSYLLPNRQDWVDEVLADLIGGRPPDDRYCPWDLVLRSLGSQQQLDFLFGHKDPREKFCDPSTLWTLAERIGPPMASFAAAAFDFQPRGELPAVLGVLDVDRAFELALQHYRHEYRRAVWKLLTADPADSLRRLSASSAKVAQHLLVDLAIAHPALTVGAIARVPHAPQDTLPSLLVTPPWSRERKAVKPFVVSGIEPTVTPGMRWVPGEREEWVATEHAYWWSRYTDWDRAVTQLRAGEHGAYQVLSFMVMGPEEVARPLLPEWQPRDLFAISEPGLKLLSVRYELAALPLVLRVIRTNFRACAPLLGPFRHVDVARAMAHWVAHAPSLRPAAVEWLSRHGVDAAALLVPDAVGKAGVLRRCAESALRVMDRAVVVEAARGYGEQVASAIESMLSTDPLDVVPARIPVPGQWADPRALPQILLADSELALPDEAAKHVMTMLALSDGDEWYPGLDVVARLCDRASLARFVVALFQRWVYTGMPAKDGWVLPALGWFGGDDAVRELAPLIKVWPGEGGNARAVKGLDTLGRIGTDLALVELYGIAQRVKFKALKTRAQEKIDAIAVERGLTTEQLADRLVPDLGLADDGSLTLNYGTRRFLVTLDEQLKPRVTDSTGKRFKTLPKPGAHDDREIAGQSYQLFSELKKKLRTVASDQIPRLEMAMVCQRTWTATEFQTLLIGHPLMWQLARRLVWLAGDTAFRVAEDRTFADVEDDELALLDDAVVRVAHPLLLGDELRRWSDLFADYQILQPFPQLGRPVFTQTGEAAFKRFVDVEVGVGKLLGLRRRGWAFDEDDSQYVMSISRSTMHGPVAMFDITPAIVLSDPTMFGEHRIGEVKLLDGVDPVTASEVLADLTELVSP